MKSRSIWSIAMVSFLLLGGTAYGKKWCCMVEGKVQQMDKKKMCIKSKSAPSEKSKQQSKKGKYFAACKELGGEWAIKEKKRPKNK